MKKIKYLLIPFLLTVLIFQSCDNLEEVDEPNFSFTPVTTKAKAGEPVEFTINNAPNFLSFFSGEFGSEYKNRNRTKADGNFTLSFETSRNYQDGDSRSDGAWRLMYSTDYAGTGSVEAVQAAQWTDISDRFSFATDRTYNKTASGLVDITDLSSDKPIYFAVRILAKGKKAEGNRQGIFDLYNFDLNLKLSETKTLEVTNLATAGWIAVNVEGKNSNSSYDNWVNRGDSFRMHGGKAEYTNDDWLITKPLNLSGSVAPDRGQPLKTYSEKLEKFSYTYSEPGTYVVTLVGNNTTIKGSTEIVKEFTIIVTN